MSAPSLLGLRVAELLHDTADGGNALGQAVIDPEGFDAFAAATALGLLAAHVAGAQPDPAGGWRAGDYEAAHAALSALGEGRRAAVLREAATRAAQLAYSGWPRPHRQG